LSKQAVALIAALLVAAGLLVAGCGGDDADADEPVISKAALIKQGDALCAEIEKSITAQGSLIFGRAEKQKDGPGFQVTIVKQVLEPEYQTMADDIRELGGPTNDKAQREAMLNAMEERVKAMAEDPKGFFEPDPVDRREFNKMLSLVKGYGFKRCYQ